MPLILQYMGSTPILLTGSASAKSARMQQAQQVVKLFKVHLVYCSHYMYMHVFNRLTESCIYMYTCTLYMYEVLCVVPLLEHLVSHSSGL